MTQKYEDYINSSAWGRKRDAALNHHGHYCTACGRDKSLQVHHLTYKRLGDEGMDDLMPLCEPCHSFVHAAGIAYSIGQINRVDVPAAVAKKMIENGLDASRLLYWSRSLMRCSGGVPPAMQEKLDRKQRKAERRERRRAKKLKRLANSRRQSELALKRNAARSGLKCVQATTPVRPAAERPTLVAMTIRRSVEDQWAACLNESDFGKSPSGQGGASRRSTPRFTLSPAEIKQMGMCTPRS